MRSIILSIGALVATMALSAQTMMPLPAHSSVYTGSARGFWFVTPSAIVITGLRVSSEAGTGTQAIQVVKILDPMPIAFTAQSSNFTNLFYTNTGANGQIIPVNIPLDADDTIGILGTAGTSNSYSSSYYVSSILGQNVSIQRFGYQGNINASAAPSIWGVSYEEAGSISRVEVYYVEAVIDEFPYCQDFDTDDGNWVSGGTANSWEHGEPDNTNISSANSGTDAWVSNLDGNYNNDESSYVRSPRLDLSGLMDPVIQFYINRDLQNGTDGVCMEISSDSGYTWTTLGSSGSTAPWYNSNSITALNAALSNGNGWTGTSGWTLMEHSLAAYNTDTSVFVRFTLASNSSTVAEGFGFDDILVGESADLSINTLIHPDMECGSSATVISAEICNRGVSEQSNFDVLLDTNGTTITTSYTGTIATCSCDTIELATINTSAGGTWNLFAEIDANDDVNSSNDTMSGVMTTYPIPNVTVSGGGEACEGQAISVTFTFQGTSPWNLQYTNGTNTITNNNLTTNPHTVLVTYAGTFEPVNLSDGSGCPTDSGGLMGSVNTVILPAPAVDLGADSIVCSGYELDAGAGAFSYVWNTGETTQTITPSADGNYSVTATGSNGCTTTEDVFLEVLPSPSVNLPDTVLCEGASVIFNAGGGGASYLWQDGSTGQLFQASSIVNVSVTVTAFNGCSSSDAGSVTAVVPNPTPVLSGTSSLAPVTLDAGAGYAAYLWNTNANTQTILVSIPGTYTCTVTDLNGCKGSDDIKTKIWATGVEDLFNEPAFNIYPNPSQGQCWIEALTPINDYAEVRLTDTKGSVVLTTLWPNGERVLELNQLSGLTSGVYTLQIVREKAAPFEQKLTITAPK